jgi:hypothetical protein
MCHHQADQVLHPYNMALSKLVNSVEVLSMSELFMYEVTKLWIFLAKNWMEESVILGRW